MPSILEIKYDANHGGLKHFAAAAVAAAKADPKGAKFLTYVPVHRAHGEHTAYIAFRDSDHSASLKDAQGDHAEVLAKNAKAGVSSCTHVAYEVTDSHGNSNSPSPYLLVVGLDHAKTSASDHISAAAALRDANAAADAPVEYHVLKSEGNPTLLTLPMDSLGDFDKDGKLNVPSLLNHKGSDAHNVVKALKGGHSSIILEYVPSSSNP
ncbi:hypothetical protein [Rhodospirillum sp. A1_3_36]|uniref:hypothetical protein n=1 Tax=Rhodospirillum sp. A1_3_36 TaxID=3391666 RepID=UPI0039A5707A